jgi:phenylpropionate dioxygenase-like ring-hydroxylating dioxygenase large terminal subunit
MDAALTARLKREIRAERDRTQHPVDFPELPGIPAQRYADQGFFDLEREHVFGRSWLLAAHASEIAQPGDFVLAEEGGAPIVVVRTRSGDVKAFYNTCQHRGAALVREPSGQLLNFKCPYHSWVYDLEGRMLGRPDERDFVRKNPDCLGLAPIRCENWGGWLFVNRDPEALPLLDYLGSVPREMEEFRVGELRQAHKQSLTLACNWKVVVEAFLEVYHLAHIHPNTAGMLLDYAATTIGLLPHGHSRMVTAKNEGREQLGFHPPGMPLIEGLGELPHTTSFSYHFFPNIVTPLDVAVFPFLVMWPVDVRTTRLDIRWHGVDWGEGERHEGWPSVFQLFDLVMAEDTANLSSIQKSIESDGFRETKLNYQERRLYHLHEQIDRLIGHGNVPEALRVPSLLGPYIESDAAG